MGTLHERIIDLCKKKGVSGSRMCLELGLSKSTLSDMKHGRTKGISTNTAQKIASYLNVSVDFLLEGNEQKNEPIVTDGLTEERKKLMEFADKVPEEKIDLILRVMQSILEEKQ